ncbi:MAG: zf-HC2 domain-containing protein [Microbacterium sp.]
MNPEHPRFADWDAAYVLGALSAPDRLAYESHLEECPECRHAIAELTSTVGLMSRLPPESVARSADAGPDSLTSQGLVDLAAQRSRRRTRTWWIAAAAAVLIVVAAVATPIAIGLRDDPMVAMASVSDVPLEASVSLAPVGWGTRVTLECSYPDVYVQDAPEDGWTYSLAIVGTDGESSSVSTWRAAPGTSARLSAGTALAVDDIAAVEIRSARGDVLMRYDLED